MHTVELGPARVAWAATSPGPVGVRAQPQVVELSAQDQARAAGFRAERRRDFVLGRALVNGLVAGLFPDASGWSVRNGACPRCRQPHGPVEVVGLPAVASVSYSHGLVVAAVVPSPPASRLGVDVERDAVDATRTEDLERLIGRSRQPLLRRWTRIEAVLKADGRGLLLEPTNVSVHGDEAMIANSPARYRIADVPGPPGYVISLAWCDAESSAASSGPASG